MFLDRYHVKLVPQNGERIWRFVIGRRQIAAVSALVALLILGSAIFALLTAASAHHEVAHLRAATAQQHTTLDRLDRQASALRATLQQVQAENARIEAAIGMPVHHPAPLARKTKAAAKRTKVSMLRARLDALALASSRTASLSQATRREAMRALNLGHVTAIAQGALEAHIPSIDPVDGAPIIGCFCYRTYPDVEFHEGVDLSADWGDPVRSAAAGVVVAASYDGGYGLKIDIDHGNGYVTWYAHLSSVDVHVGESVLKGELIGRVGTTGFSTGPHLHYQVMLDGTPVNPTPFLNGIPRNVIASAP